MGAMWQWSSWCIDCGGGNTKLHGGHGCRGFYTRERLSLSIQRGSGPGPLWTKILGRSSRLQKTYAQPPAYFKPALGYL